MKKSIRKYTVILLAILLMQQQLPGRPPQPQTAEKPQLAQLVNRRYLDLLELAPALTFTWTRRLLWGVPSVGLCTHDSTMSSAASRATPDGASPVGGFAVDSSTIVLLSAEYAENSSVPEDVLARTL